MQEWEHNGFLVSPERIKSSTSLIGDLRLVSGWQRL